VSTYIHKFLHSIPVPVPQIDLLLGITVWGWRPLLCNSDKPANHITVSWPKYESTSLNKPLWQLGYLSYMHQYEDLKLNTAKLYVHTFGM